jgi:hypothetical protein
MSGCTITPITTNKACSGKCKSGGCRTTPRVWVVAACEGMISLFEKNAKGALASMSQDGNAVFASLDAFRKSLDTAEYDHSFDQLVIIGSSSDIAWIHASLPQSAMRHIVAEIEYPLMAGWFKQPLPLPNLTHALEGVFAA